MPREKYERREKSEKFQTFTRPKVKIARIERVGQNVHRLQRHGVFEKDGEQQRENPGPQAHGSQRDGTAHDGPRSQTGTLSGPAALRERDGVERGDIHKLPAAPGEKRGVFLCARKSRGIPGIPRLNRDHRLKIPELTSCREWRPSPPWRR